MTLPDGPDRLPSRDVRISDAEREAVIDVLRHHTGEGRLTLDEFSDRVGEVYAARTAGDLEQVTIDLPEPAAPPSSMLPAPPPRRRKAVRFTMSIMGGNSRKGRWRVPSRTAAFALMGGMELDLRKAEFEGDEINITAVAVMGGIDIIVPDGVEVELNGLAIMGGKDCRVRPQNLGPAAPLVRVRALAVMGGVTVRTKTPRADRKLLKAARRALDAIETPATGELEPASQPARAAGATASVPTGTVTIMFTDIEGSTELFERIGDGAARRVLAEHNRLVRNQVEQCGGHEVKNSGDGFMVVFPSAAKALRCAAALQREFAGFHADEGRVQVRVRIGLHTGDVEAQDGDFVGRAVTMAARIADAADGTEVLVSSLVRELAGSSGEFAFGDGRAVDLKGLTGQHVVHPLDWKA